MGKLSELERILLFLEFGGITEGIGGVPFSMDYSSADLLTASYAQPISH